MYLYIVSLWVWTSVKKNKQWIIMTWADASNCRGIERWCLGETVASATFNNPKHRRFSSVDFQILKSLFLFSEVRRTKFYNYWSTKKIKVTKIILIKFVKFLIIIDSLFWVTFRNFSKQFLLWLPELITQFKQIHVQEMRWILCCLNSFESQVWKLWILWIISNKDCFLVIFESDWISWFWMNLLKNEICIFVWIMFTEIF